MTEIPFESIIKTELRDYQNEVVDAMVDKKRYVIADGVGMGKTLAVLASFKKLHDEDPTRRLLVFANASSISTWTSEVPKHSNFRLVTGESARWQATLKKWEEEDPHIVVLTYSAVSPRSKKRIKEESLSKSQEALISADYITYYVPSNYRDKIVQTFEDRDGSMVLALEEAHYCKSPDTVRYGFVAPIVTASEYVWMMTATPIVNRLTDLYHLFNLLIPGFFGTEGDFLQMYTIRETKKVARKRWVKEIVGYKNIDELKDKISEFMIKRAMENINVSFVPVYGKMSAEEERLYLQAARGILDETEDVRDFGARLPDLQLVVDGAVLENREPNTRARIMSKERLLLKGLKKSYASSGDKAVIVFCYFGLTYKRLKFVLEHAVGKLGFDRLLTLNAATSTQKRTEICKEFGPRDLLLLTSAGKESLNLKAADELWFYDIPFSLGDVIQTVGRMTRMDSVYSDFKVYLPAMEETIDVYKMNMMVHKSALVSAVLKQEATIPKSNRKVSANDLKELRRELLWRVRTA